jgi:hypothetical protein
LVGGGGALVGSWGGGGGDGRAAAKVRGGRTGRGTVEQVVDHAGGDVDEDPAHQRVHGDEQENRVAGGQAQEQVADSDGGHREPEALVPPKDSRSRGQAAEDLRGYAVDSDSPRGAGDRITDQQVME